MILINSPALEVIIGLLGFYIIARVGIQLYNTWVLHSILKELMKGGKQPVGKHHTETLRGSNGITRTP